MEQRPNTPRDRHRTQGYGGSKARPSDGTTAAGASEGSAHGEAGSFSASQPQIHWWGRNSTSDGRYASWEHKLGTTRPDHGKPSAIRRFFLWLAGFHN